MRGGEEGGALEATLNACYGEYRDLVVQALVDHDGYETKVYCIGKAVHMSRRRLAATVGDGTPLVVFDSLEMKSSQCGTEEHPISGDDEDLLKECAGWLRAKLGVALFGFDALKEKGTGKVAIIDVNYFPSFKGIPTAASDLTKAVVSRLSEISLVT